MSISNPIALPESWESEPEESPETQRPVSWVCTVEKYQAQTAKSPCFKVEGKEQHRGCFLPSTCVVGTPVCSVLLSHAPSLLCLSLSVSLFLSLCLCCTHTHTNISDPTACSWNGKTTASFNQLLLWTALPYTAQKPNNSKLNCTKLLEFVLFAKQRPFHKS